jgi:hypothetical protein
MEGLEERLAPAVFNVHSTADILNPPAGVVTLRSAIQQANATPGSNTINLTVAGTYKITLAGAAPFPASVEAALVAAALVAVPELGDTPARGVPGRAQPVPGDRLLNYRPASPQRVHCVVRFAL